MSAVVPDGTAEALDRYAQLLRSAPLGLLSQRDRQLAHLHIADCLVAYSLLSTERPEHFVDVGSGGGLPGIPLALAMPQALVTLVESQERKARFLVQMCEQLGLARRVTVLAQRAEQVVDSFGREQFDVGVSRATAPPPVALEYLAPLVRVGGRVVLWSTVSQAHPAALVPAARELGLERAELVEAPTELRNDGVLLVCQKTAATPPRYPRRVGVARQRPL